MKGAHKCTHHAEQAQAVAGLEGVEEGCLLGQAGQHRGGPCRQPRDYFSNTSGLV